jgi:hypothetical protein
MVYHTLSREELLEGLRVPGVSCALPSTQFYGPKALVLNSMALRHLVLNSIALRHLVLNSMALRHWYSILWP